jgi:biopolymer transport protein ExbD
MDFTRAAMSELDEGRSVPLTPLIDVVFLLLIFLLFGDFRHQEGEVSSRIEPTAAAAPAGGGQMLLTLRQDAGGARVQIGRPAGAAPLVTAELDSLDVRSVRRALRDAGVADPSSMSAVIAPQGAVDFRYVMQLWDRCRDMGFNDIGLRAGVGEPR